MFAVAFDFVVADAERYHPKGMTQAYRETGEVLGRFGFRRKQGSVYLTEDENLVNLMNAMLALRSLPWFPKVVRDVRAFGWNSGLTSPVS